MRWIIGVIVSTGVALAGSSGVYTFTGTATGTIGGTPFTNATLTVTSTGDVSAIVCTSVCRLDLGAGATSITISSVGTGTVSVASYVFSVPGNGMVGFGAGNDDIQMSDAALGGTALAGYNLKSSIGLIGPQAVDPSVGDWTNMSTSLGTLAVTSYTNFTFQGTAGSASTAVPTVAPAGLVLLTLGLAGLAVWKFRAVFAA